MKKTVICPNCGGQAPWSEQNPYRPFCSERCRLIDLGAWIEERHRIPGDDRPSEQHHDATANATQEQD